MATKKTENMRAAISGIHQSARRKAFRKNLPVAVSEDGKTILIFPDGTRKPYTPEAIATIKQVHQKN
jgi:1-acyl-sn-glycerol-3-phosphate acyltransferase